MDSILNTLLEDSHKFDRFIVDEEVIPITDVEICNIQYIKSVYDGFVVYLKTGNLVVTGKLLGVSPTEIRIQAIQRAFTE